MQWSLNLGKRLDRSRSDLDMKRKCRVDSATINRQIEKLFFISFDWIVCVVPILLFYSDHLSCMTEGAFFYTDKKYKESYAIYENISFSIGCIFNEYEKVENMKQTESSLRG